MIRFKRFVLFLIAAIMLLSTAVLIGCSKDDSVAEYTITFDYGEGSGEVLTLTIKADVLITELPTPSSCPAEQVFVGWLTENGDIVTKDTKFTFESNITLYANYKVKEYSIEYNLNGGDSLPVNALRTYCLSDKDQDLPVPSRNGYEFTGWQIKDTTTVLKAIHANTKSDLSLIAQWQVNAYTITFNYGDGSGEENTRTVNYGVTVTDLPLVTPPDEKVFSCWRVNSTDGELFAKGTAYLFAEDITLYACFEIVSYKITFDVNGGDPLPADTKQAYDFSEESQSLPVATRAGYTFKGWLIEDTETVLTAIPAGKTGDLSLVATWQVNKYTITFNYGDNEAGDETTRVVSYGETVTDLPTIAAPEGKVFGWRVNSTDGELFVNGTAYTFTEDITLYACFDVANYKITFNPNGGALPAGTELSYSYSEESQILPVPTRTGYEFKGWKVGETEEVITEIPAKQESDLSLIAQWQVKTFKITFDYGEEGSGEVTEKQVTYGDLVAELPTATPTSGKAFDGWHVNSADGELFAQGTAYTFTEDITLYACYTAASYNIAFDTNGGDPLPSDTKLTYTFSDGSQPLPVATKAGYDFIGWKVGETEDVITEIPANKTGNLNLSAVWGDKTYNITFDSGVETIIKIKYGETINDLPKATPPSDKGFYGWETADGVKVENGMAFNFDKDIELKAIFGAKKFTVTIRNTTKASFTAWADDTSGDKVVEIEIGGKITIPKIKYDNMSSTDKKNHDYKFSGWYYTDKDGKVKKLDLDTAFTFENLNVDTYEIMVFAKVSKQWSSSY